MTVPADPADPAGPAATGDGSGRGRYLLASPDGDLLSGLAARLAADGRGRVLRAPAAGLLAIEATPALVADLRAEHVDRLVIEPDAPLDLFPTGPATPA